ncbi:hydrogenase iron-sulfur subunit [Fibrobacterota bacterium]
MPDFEPRIIAFVCNWCSYAGADQAGGQKLSYPAGLRLIRVMCSGRVDPQFVMRAFREGADGVLVLGCHPGDCHYRNGNMKALRRFRLFETMLSQFGIDKERFRLDWVAAGEGRKFQELTTAMTEAVKSLGPVDIKGMVAKEVA